MVVHKRIHNDTAAQVWPLCFFIHKKYLCSDNYLKELLKSVMCQIHNNDHLKEWKDNCPVPLIIEIPEENFEYEIYC